MQAKGLDQILSRLFVPSTGNFIKDQITVVVPGDKFKKTQSAFDICCGWSSTLLYPKSQHEAIERRMATGRREWEDFIQQVRNMQDYDNMTNYMRNTQFLILLAGSVHVVGDAFREDVVRTMFLRRKITHRSVRPNVEAYDVDYYSSNLKDAQNKVWLPGHVNHEFIIGKIEENDEKYDHQVIYWMSDVHYYLYDWTPSNQKDEDWFTCTGNNFSQMPGRTVLPFGEGIVTVTGDGRVIMNTRASGLHYIHDHIKLCNPTAAYDFGFFQIATSQGHPRDFLLYKYEATGFDTLKSLQSNFLIDALHVMRNT